ncbi:GntR family transcriptional regulator [Oceanicaulis alexandrii]|uniref:GntR family transcriptional regulator n=1 Tax=Oceanicaulis alexandrii TaxID=153233 RepID=UPI003B512340
MHPYETIRTEMLRRINDQTWPAGHTLPREDDLAEEFGVARGTIRRALSSLSEAGLIERKRRAGTRVVDRRGHRSTLTIPIVRHEIEARGAVYGYRRICVDDGASSPLDQALFKGAPLRHVRCLHLSDGKPFQLEDRFINLDTVPEAADAPFDTVSPNEWLVQRAPYSFIRTALRAELAHAIDQTHLGLTESEPVFVIERQTRFRDSPLTSVRLSHAASAFQIVTESGDLV